MHPFSNIYIKYQEEFTNIFVNRMNDGWYYENFVNNTIPHLSTSFFSEFGKNLEELIDKVILEIDLKNSYFIDKHKKEIEFIKAYKDNLPRVSFFLSILTRLPGTPSLADYLNVKFLSKGVKPNNLFIIGSILEIVCDIKSDVRFEICIKYLSYLKDHDDFCDSTNMEYAAIIVNNSSNVDFHYQVKKIIEGGGDEMTYWAKKLFDIYNEN